MPDLLRLNCGADIYLLFNYLLSHPVSLLRPTFIRVLRLAYALHTPALPTSHLPTACQLLASDLVQFDAALAPTITIGQLQPSTLQLLTPCFERWLARADFASAHPIDRRCFGIACLVGLVQTARESPVAVTTSVSGSTGDTELIYERLAMADTFHTQWLERIVDLCIQVVRWLCG
ncbi:unnamed protein product [Protopolystoma xenopodis]|uniref:Uncharacterized protein n=1 Tax=Protopolystoma xenopodis TaxID=117903 RepID=A0A3S5AHT9_9PLAT|nr:unnamed protein product [Protopolystoma xenopodis]